MVLKNLHTRKLRANHADHVGQGQDRDNQAFSATMRSSLASGPNAASRPNTMARLRRGLISLRTAKSLPRYPAMAPDGTMAIPTPARTKLIIVANWVTVAACRSVCPAVEAAPSIMRRVRESWGKETNGKLTKSFRATAACLDVLASG